MGLPWSSEMASFDPNGSGSAQMRISASELNGTPLRARARLGLTPRHVCGGTWAHPCHDSGSPLGRFPRPRPPSGTGTALAQVKQTNTRTNKHTNNARAPDVAEGVHEAAVPLVVSREAPDRRHLRARACAYARALARARSCSSFLLGQSVRVGERGVRCACQQPDRVGVVLGFVCGLLVALFVCLLGRPLLAFLACPARLPPRRSQPVDSGGASIRRLCVRGRPKQSNGRSFPWQWRLRLFRAVASRGSAGRVAARSLAHVRAGVLVVKFVCLFVCLFVCFRLVALANVLVCLLARWFASFFASA
jgi:hypothetical protein